MAEHTIFYAWQNDISSECNRYFIRDALKKAIVKLESDGAIENCPRLDHDTRGVPGTPAISDTIFEKIGKANLFVADVTFIGRNDTKYIPNPNVMIELGYALSAVSSRRIILVMNSSFGGPEELPFDLRHRRFPICYHLEEDSAKETKAVVLSDLTVELHRAMRDVLNATERKEPDRNLQLRICSTRNGKQQLAQIRLFNSGPGPIFVESWWVEWGPEGRRGGNESVETVRGKLPVRIEEQDAADLLVKIFCKVEEITGIGVFDGDHHLWLASEKDLDIFKRVAIDHRLPIKQSDDDQQSTPEPIEVEIVARAKKARENRASAY